MSIRLLRYQLRWAWAKMGCRCSFDRHHIKRVEDSHCPVHGWQTTKESDPEGWENVRP